MRRMAIGLLLVGLLVLAAIGPLYAQQFPTVASLKPFSAETNFMSLPGYLRWLVFSQTGQWITRAEAVRIVNEQQSLAGP